MDNNYYVLAGTVNVPEEKKEELNYYITELLYKGGIRKTEEIILDERKFTVVDRVCPNDNGILEFDYSIFEKKLRKCNNYNLDSCMLSTPD